MLVAGMRGRSKPLLWSGTAVAVVVAAVVILVLPHGVELVAAAALAVGIVAVLRRPQWALYIFAAGLPLHNMLMALLYRATGSATFVKLAQPWKETLLAMALLSAAWAALARWRQGTRPRLTLLDALVALFVLVCAISVLLPSHLVSLLGRLYGFRDLVVPFAAYALGRLAPLSWRQLKGLLGVFGAATIIFGLAAIGERGIWGERLLFATNYGAYLKTFLGLVYPLPHNTPYSFYAAGWFPRAGSLLLSPLDFSEFLMIMLPVLLTGLALARRHNRRRAVIGLSAALVIGGAALILAYGRASIGLILLGVVVLLVIDRIRWQWTGIVLGLLGAVLGAILFLTVASYVAAPNSSADKVALADQGLLTLITSPPNSIEQGPDTLTGSARTAFEQSASPTNSSTVGHLASLERLGTLLLHHPFGIGIGAVGLNGVRFNTNLGAEDSYLSVGVQLGVLPFLLYLAIFSTGILTCWRVVRSRRRDLLRAVYLGLSVGWLLVALNGTITQITANLFAMYVLWFVTGMATPVLDHTRVRAVVAGDGASPRWVAERPLRIAMDVQCLQTARTGVRTYAEELLRQFARPESPHSVVRMRGPRRLPSGVRAFRIVNQAMYFAWLHGLLPVRLWLGNYDVLFSPEYLTSFWSPVARVVTFHDAMFLRRPQDYNKLWLWLFHRVSLPALRRAQAVLVPSQHAADETVRYAGVRRERVYVVPLGGPAHGEPPRVDSAAAERTLARFGVRPWFYILHVGVLERRKNLVTLVRAFALWRAQGAPPDVKLVLVGQPGPRPDLDDSQQIHQTIGELGLGANVVLTGHLTAAERDAFYTHATMVAVPSLLEGFGLPVLEAFAARVPVLAAQATALPEVAGNAALYFDPTNPQSLADSFKRLYGNAALRDALVRAGNQQLQHFTWERTAAGTLDACEAAAVRAYAPGPPAHARWTETQVAVGAGQGQHQP